MLLLALAVSPFQSSIQPLPAAVRAEVRATAWHPGCPVPLSDLRGRIEGLLHSPQGTAVIAAVAVVAAVHGLRSAWFQVHRYGR